MSLTENTLSGPVDKVQRSIERLRIFEPEEGYFLAFSGGKDSVVIHRLAQMAGVKYDAHYNVTSVDPPELVQFVKECMKRDPKISFDYPTDKDGNRITMWSLIEKKKIPPTRLSRYCCEALKESSGKGRVTVTGVRWAESKSRCENQGTVVVVGAKKQEKQLLSAAGAIENTKNGIILNADNHESRRAVEQCYRTCKTLVNPIIDWTDADVWEFIHTHEIPYCSLYDEGFDRLGCIGCPLGSNQNSELDRWPTYRRAYIRAFDKMLKARHASGRFCNSWVDGIDVMNWYTDTHKKEKIIDGQMELEEA